MKSSSFTFFISTLAVLAGAGWIALCGLVFWIQADAPSPLIEFDLFLKLVIGVAPLVQIWMLAFMFHSSVVRSRELEHAHLEIAELQRTTALLVKKQRLLEDTLVEDSSTRRRTGRQGSTAEELAFEGQRPGTGPESHEDPLLAMGEGSMFSVAPAIIIRALNFPENLDDVAGYEAYDAAIREPAIGKLLNYAEKVLEGLAAEGVYMESVDPEYGRAELWRMHASGAVGQEISNLGSIDDQRLLGHVATRLKTDGDLLELGQAMVDQFHIVLHEFVRVAEDPELFDLIMTRTAKAYILLGHVLDGKD